LFENWTYVYLIKIFFVVCLPVSVLGTVVVVVVVGTVVVVVVVIDVTEQSLGTYVAHSETPTKLIYWRIIFF